jgi:hypothetical protein
MFKKMDQLTMWSSISVCRHAYGLRLAGATLLLIRVIEQCVKVQDLPSCKASVTCIICG